MEPGVTESGVPDEGSAERSPEALASQTRYRQLRENGFLVFRGLWPAEAIAALRDALERNLPHYAAGDRAAIADAFDVGDGRFVSPIAFAPPFDLEGIMFNPALCDLFALALGPDWVVEALGVIIAAAGARKQDLHHDGELLFPETGVDKLLPPWALTVAIPLVPVDGQNGATAFLTGSHRNGMPKDQQADTELHLQPGDCAIWDFRTIHHGQANNSPAARPILYLTVCRPYWTDRNNFTPGRNTKLVASREAVARLPDGSRKRLVRAQVSD